MAFTSRFAPSPTGLLHRGHAFSAVIGHAAAQATGGKWLLRIEDIDEGRVRPEFTPAIIEDLGWLGLEPDGPVMIQTRRRPAHLLALEELRARGLLYACTCTRADIARAARAPHAGETLRYPGTCRGQPAPGDGTAFAWRLDLAATGLPAGQGWRDIAAGAQHGPADTGGDPVLMRKDGAIAYHLACVLDDAAQGITLVTRGLDLIESTPVQRVLQQLLRVPEPLYLHHGLLLDASGRRLAKRDRAETLAALRAAGEDGRRIAKILLRQSAPLLKAAGIAVEEKS